MKLARTRRWATAGAALGLSTAVFAGVAFAATPGSAGHAAGSPATAGASAPALAATAATTSTTATPPGGNAASGTQAPAGTSPMMSAMLASLSPQARAELQALYPQMLKFMDSSQMMSGTGTAGSMMGQPRAGNRPTAGQASAS